ncbi:MAG: hypothetical protein OEZ10_05965 [Gammaproteobacteria bacterium]|nr:hypothetical protein [Gammaproteobacteria bacterium]
MFWSKWFGDKTKKPASRQKKKKHQHRKKRSSRDPLQQFVVEEIELSAPAATVVAAAPEASPGAASRVRWKPLVRMSTGWISLCVMVAVAAIFSRSAWPLDETRLLGQAWEMWRDEQWLVPVLNGAADWRTPPLMHWIILYLWQFTGAEEWLARALPAVFAGLTTIFMVLLARNLWPGRADIARYAPFTLFGLLFWSAFSGFLLADMAVVLFVTMAMWGVSVAAYRSSTPGWLIVFVALALGIFAGGLPILWYVLPIMILAPAWVREDARVAAGRWYGLTIMTSAAALAIAVYWWSVARINAGPELLQWLQLWLLPQPAQYFSVSMPWWGYLLFLPIVFLPWSIWPLVWMRLWHIRREQTNRGLLFVVLWGLPMLALLCVLEPRQPHFLLPLFPAFALAVTYLLFDDELADRGEDSVLASMSFPTIVVGGLLAILPKLPRIEFLPEWLWQLPPWAGLLVGVMGVFLAWTPAQRIPVRMMNMSIAGVMVIVMLNLAAGWRYQEVLGNEKTAGIIGLLQGDGRLVAYIGSYSGQYHFAGRIRTNFTILEPDEIINWVNDNPTGVLLAQDETWMEKARLTAPRPAYRAKHGDDTLIMWEAGGIGMKIDIDAVSEPVGQ